MRDKLKVSPNNDFFYNLIKDYLINEEMEFEGISFDLRDFEKEIKKDEKKLIPLFKVFSPAELLKEPFSNDSNNLNKEFYLELLHIIGLEEHKEGSKKIIGRKEQKKRDGGSLLENTIRILQSEDSLKNMENPGHFGETEDEQLFNLALELNITWINRILFLKLLEAQLVNYHKGDNRFKFLNPKTIKQYDDLYELFHEVLAARINERSKDIIEKFKNIPYLNSSLFDRTELERKTIRISNLKDRFDLDFYSHTVFSKDTKAKGKLPALEYLLRFLDAYDFASESGGEIQEERKTIINASVLGLIFEKINGYKEGSFYTPGFITMYMARETSRRAVVQKFNEAKETDYKNYDELKKDINSSSAGREEANEIINSLKICDPAVGSGHFLVSCLNEIIAIKADLRILNDREGRQIRDFSFIIENDELVITDEKSDELFTYYLNPNGKPITIIQEMQETLFHEKETIIENCLFGVDINPNSVNICRLRLWIELLKNSYYNFKSGGAELQTLPNIDINIKQGNSLISRFDIKQDIFSRADKQTLEVYKMNVQLYKSEQDKAKRRELKESIEKTRNRFKGIAIDPLKKEREQTSKLAEQLHDLNKEDLFTKDLTEQEKHKIENKRNSLTDKIEKLSNEIEKKTEEYRTIYSNAFEWRFEFPEVLDEEGNFSGFDVVIGNPPYISHDKIKEKEFLKNHYKSYEPFADIYCYFIERGLEIIGGKNVLNYITSNSFLKAEYGKPLRDLLIENGEILFIANIEDTQIFEDAIVNTAIILYRKGVYKSKALIVNEKYNLDNDFIDFINKNKFYYEQEDFKSLSWTLIRPEKLKLGYKIDSAGMKLKNLNTQINLGLATGANDVFIINEEKRNELLTLDSKNINIIKPILRGRDIQKYSFIFNNNYILLTRNEVNVESEYPQIYNYLSLFGEKFKNRGAQGKHWTNLRACSFFDDFKKEKIIWIELSPENRFAYCQDEIYLLNTAYFLISPEEFYSKYLLSILNSKVIKFYLNLIANTSGMGVTRWINIYVREFPIPLISKEKQKPFINLVDQILERKKQNPKADTSELEKQIDEMVYKLYGLTEEEIKIVEGKER